MPNWYNLNIMKRVILFLISILLIFSAYAAEKSTVTFFYSPQCKKCLELKEEFFPSFKEKYKDKLIWKEVNVLEKKNFIFLMAVSTRLRKTGAYVPTILVGDTFLVGKNEIKSKLEKAIETALKKKATPFDFFKVDVLQIFNKLSLLTVVTSGLIDGINPCAFAVIVFFVSFLAVYGYRKRSILYVGIFYCLAVFIAYLLIGLGVFKFLYSMVGFYRIIKYFYYFVAAFCFILAAFALYDYFRYKRTKETDGLILQLPAFLKKQITTLIGSQLREKKEEGVLSLSISAFVVGFLVSLLEAACTGQIYLPTIVFILRSSTMQTKAFAYLIIYNLMFVLPLVIVFILSLAGFSSERFNKFLKDNMAAIKFLMFLVFVLLGVVILCVS